MAPGRTRDAPLRIQEALRPENVGSRVAVQGWVRTKRASKAGITFIELNDGSSLRNLQVIVPDDLPSFSEVDPLVTTGASLHVLGDLVDSPATGQATELRAESVRVLGPAPDYPLAKKRHSFEYLRTMAHLRPRTNTFGAMARVRNEVSRSIHEYFQSHGYLYVQTPIITAVDAEGAGDMFHVTSLDIGHSEPRDVRIDWSQDLFGQPTHLTVSGQLQAEIMATALTNVYTFGPTFRAENSNTSRHLSEFWMVEPEIAFCDLDGLMNVAEEFLKKIFSDLLTNVSQDIQFFNDRIDSTVIETLHHIIATPFVRLTYSEAIDVLQASQRDFEFPVAWGADLQAEHERYLTEEHFKSPVILSDYPASIKAFYMRLNADNRTVAAMDVLVPKIGEIIGGSQREERIDVLVSRMREHGLNPDQYWWYVDLRRYGTVKHAGFGLGLERVVQFATGMGNIRDVIPFPRSPRNVDF